MNREARTWALIWLLVSTAVAAGIIAGFLLLSALAPGAARAATFEAIGTAGITVVGTSNPSPAVLQLRKEVRSVRLFAASDTPRWRPPSGALTSRAGITKPSAGSLRTLTPARRPAPAHPAARGPSVATLAASPAPPGGVAGVASWWASFGPGIYAALPGYVAGTPVTIRIWSGKLYVDAPVVTSCRCFVGTSAERIVDVSPGVLAALGLDPARGLYPITVERLP